MSAKAQNGISPEIEQAINYAVGAAFAKAQTVQSVLANHSLTNMPAATTAITTGATALGTGTLTAVRPTTKVRVLLVGVFNETNTGQAVLTPTVTFTINGANTATLTTPTIPTIAMPGNTSTPTVGVYSAVYDYSVATTAAQTPGQTISAAVSFVASSTGAAAPQNGFALSLQEIF